MWCKPVFTITSRVVWGVLLGDSYRPGRARSVGLDQSFGAWGITPHVSSRRLTTAWGCSKNYIGEAGAASLVEAIKHLSSLQSLDMGCVGYGSERVWRGGGIG